MILAAILAQCSRDAEREAASTGKRETVQRAKATPVLLDYAGELHESRFTVPKQKRALMNQD